MESDYDRLNRKEKLFSKNGTCPRFNIRIIYIELCPSRDDSKLLKKKSDEILEETIVCVELKPIPISS